MDLSRSCRYVSQSSFGYKHNRATSWVPLLVTKGQCFGRTGCSNILGTRLHICSSKRFNCFTGQFLIQGKNYGISYKILTLGQFECHETKFCSIETSRKSCKYMLFSVTLIFTQVHRVSLHRRRSLQGQSFGQIGCSNIPGASQIKRKFGML